MCRYLRTTLRPAAYHGRGMKPPFFEGWYFKEVDAGSRHRYAVIPGIYLSRDKDLSHAFIQVSDGSTGQATYHRFPVEDFSAAYGKFDICIGSSRFSTHRMSLDIRDRDFTLSGELEFLSPVPWPVTLFSPGNMGWYAWVPFMECYHGVVSLDHGIEGKLTFNGKPVDFTGGRGYIEKDWGRSFPSAWIWMQSNGFGSPGISVTASVAIIPWLGGSFPGFTIGMLHGGSLYRFATYTRAHIERLDATDRTITLSVKDKHHRLEIEAVRSQGSLLRAPTTTEMDRRITETLTSKVCVKLYSLKGGGMQKIFQGTGLDAGLEAAGDMQRLKDLWIAGR